VKNAFDFPGFVPAYVRPLFCRGKGPFRWVALSGDPEDIRKTDAKMKELFPADAHLHRWLDMAGERIAFQGLPARICWIGLGERHRAGLAFNEMVKSGELKAPIVIGRDHLDSGSVASPNRETEAMQDGSDAVSDWPLLNALLNTAGWRHLGQPAPRRRRGHGLQPARGRGDRLRRQRRSRAPHRTGAVERPGHRCDAPCRRRLRRSRGLRARAGPEPADGGLMLLRPGQLSLEELQAIHAGGHQPLVMDPSALPRILASAAVVQRAAEGDAPVYGVNTGFGKLASTRISAEDLATLQRNLIRSHSVGVGEPLAPGVMRLMLATKAASLARGHSGVRPVVIDTLLAVHNAGLIPYVPSQGSVGASGDLAPLSHMTLALMGEGEFLVEGQRQPAAEVLRAKGIAPLQLQAKEGLALINGTQTSTALALHALFSFEPVLEAALVVVRTHRGRGARQRRPLRPAHPRAARPAGPDRRGAVLPRAAGRQCHPQESRRRRRPRARPVLPALPAAGGGCVPGSAATRRLGAAARGQCGHGQPAGVQPKTAA
jgi:hypothetical protein